MGSMRQEAEQNNVIVLGKVDELCRIIGTMTIIDEKNWLS